MAISDRSQHRHPWRFWAHAKGSFHVDELAIISDNRSLRMHRIVPTLDISAYVRSFRTTSFRGLTCQNLRVNKIVPIFQVAQIRLFRFLLLDKHLCPL